MLYQQIDLICRQFNNLKRVLKMKAGPTLIDKMLGFFSQVIPDEQTTRCILEGFSLVFSDMPLDTNSDDLALHADPLDAYSDDEIAPGKHKRKA